MSLKYVVQNPYDPNLYDVSGDCASCGNSVIITTKDPAKYSRPTMLFMCGGCTRGTLGYTGESTSEESREESACECGSEKAGIPGHSSYCPKYTGRK